MQEKEKKVDPPYKCPHCHQRRFKSPHYVKQHYFYCKALNKNKNEPSVQNLFVCEYCGRNNFKRQCSLDQHKKACKEKQKHDINHFQKKLAHVGGGANQKKKTRKPTINKTDLKVLLRELNNIQKQLSSIIE